MAKAQAKADSTSTPKLADSRTEASESLTPLLRFYDQGQLIQATMNEQDCNRHSAIERLRKEGVIELSVNEGDKAETFARRFTREEVKEMTDTQGPFPLTRAHIEVLIYVEDNNHRREYMKQAIDEQLSSRRLRQICGPRNANRSTSGRKFSHLQSSDELGDGLQKVFRQPLRYIDLVLEKASKGQLAVSDANRNLLKDLQKHIEKELNRFQRAFKKKSPDRQG